ncbi:hypothetical protein [Halovenus sp. HT40]|uniref:hypothetical protein n=1 Tax=Halovenus sp. HT40 TaxID=3126691 RepID=UPI00300E79A5
MYVPVGDDAVANVRERDVIQVKIDETMSLDFDMSNSAEYVETGAVEGQTQIDFEVNRSELLEYVERADSPSIIDKLRAILEDWSTDGISAQEINLNYGRLLFKGAEPIGMTPTVELNDTIHASELQSKSPDELKRDLRKEWEYETSYDQLAQDIGEYLEREGITANPSFSAPVHMQARAHPAVDGTDYTIELDNNEFVPIHRITLQLKMDPEVGREVKLGHEFDEEEDNWSGSDLVDGSYDPEDNVYTVEIRSRDNYALPSAEQRSSTRQVRFHVPSRSQKDLQEIAGRVHFTRDRPFSNLTPVALFDAGGHCIGKFGRYDRWMDADVVDIDATGRIDATFHTPTEDVAVSSTAEITKKVTVEGVTPIQAFSRIEEVLDDRGIDGLDAKQPEKERQLQEGKEAEVYSGHLRNGYVLENDTRIEINISVEGSVRSADVERSREEDENLPAERRSVSRAYGDTNLTVRGRGANRSVVESYVADLRDELNVTLKSISEEM